jgi:integrase
LALLTGLSLCDLIKLDDSMVNEQSGVIDLKRTKTRQPQRSPLTPEVMDLIREAREERAKCKVRPANKGLLHFCMDGNHAGKPLPKSMVQARHYRACQTAKITGYRFHDHRHTCASRMARNNVPVRIACRAMGWSSASMMRVYEHLGPR